MRMSMRNHEYSELVKKVQNGDKDAFEMLVEKYKQQVFNKCYFDLSRNRDLAEEAAHMTFIKAFKSIKNFRGHAAFYTWLYKIAENTCKDLRKKIKREKRIITSESDFPKNEENNPSKEIFIDPRDPQDRFEKEEIRQMARNCIENLSEKLRSIVLLHYYDRLKYKEISSSLGIPEGTAKKRVHNALKSLQQCFRNKGLLK